MEYQYQFHINELGIWLLREDGNVQDTIKAGNFWEAELLPVFNKLPSDFIVAEVGSYIGDHTIHLAKRCKRIYAFEGNTLNYLQLCANVGLNKIKNIDAYNMVMGAIPQTSREVIHPSTAPACTLFEVDADGDKSVHTLDIELSSLEKLDYIKTDCEGMDLDVLLGAKNLITKFKPMITFEYLEGVSVQILDEYLTYLKSFNYAITQLATYNWLATSK